MVLDQFLVVQARFGDLVLPLGSSPCILNRTESSVWCPLSLMASNILILLPRKSSIFLDENSEESWECCVKPGVESLVSWCPGSGELSHCHLQFPVCPIQRRIIYQDCHWNSGPRPYFCCLLRLWWLQSTDHQWLLSPSFPPVEDLWRSRLGIFWWFL